MLASNEKHTSTFVEMSFSTYSSNYSIPEAIDGFRRDLLTGVAIVKL